MWRFSNSFAGHCVDNPNLNDEVSRFSLERSPLLSLAENDMIDENLNVTRLQSNMSAPHVNIIHFVGLYL
jgi:hypothetical protein